VLKPLKIKPSFSISKKPFLFFDNLAGISPFLVEILQKRKRSDEIIDNGRTNPATKTIVNSIPKSAISNWHRKYQEIAGDLAKRWAGYWGENALANYFKELSHDKHLIFHDLHQLPNLPNFFKRSHNKCPQ
jgi:hypothetical protein